MTRLGHGQEELIHQSMLYLWEVWILSEHVEQAPEVIWKSSMFLRQASGKELVVRRGHFWLVQLGPQAGCETQVVSYAVSVGCNVWVIEDLCERVTCRLA